MAIEYKYESGLTISDMLVDLKKHLNIESDFTDDDTYLTSLLYVTQTLIQEYLNDFTLSGATEIATPIYHSIILLAGHFYLNRNMVSFSQGVEIPYTFKFLLAPYKNYVIS